MEPDPVPQPHLVPFDTDSDDKAGDGQREEVAPREEVGDDEEEVEQDEEDDDQKILKMFADKMETERTASDDKDDSQDYLDGHQDGELSAEQLAQASTIATSVAPRSTSAILAAAAVAASSTINEEDEHIFTEDGEVRVEKEPSTERSSQDAILVTLVWPFCTLDENEEPTPSTSAFRVKPTQKMEIIFERFVQTLECKGITSQAIALEAKDFSFVFEGKVIFKTDTPLELGLADGMKFNCFPSKPITLSEGWHLYDIEEPQTFMGKVPADIMPNKSNDDDDSGDDDSGDDDSGDDDSGDAPEPELKPIQLSLLWPTKNRKVTTFVIAPNKPFINLFRQFVPILCRETNMSIKERDLCFSIGPYAIQPTHTPQFWCLKDGSCFTFETSVPFSLPGNPHAPGNAQVPTAQAGTSPADKPENKSEQEADAEGTSDAGSHEDEPSNKDGFVNNNDDVSTSASAEDEDDESVVASTGKDESEYEASEEDDDSTVVPESDEEPPAPSKPKKSTRNRKKSLSDEELPALYVPKRRTRNSKQSLSDEEWLMQDLEEEKDAMGQDKGKGKNKKKDNRTNRGNRKRKALSYAKTPKQQLDTNVRSRLDGAYERLQKAQSMSRPRSRTDDYVPPPDYESDTESVMNEKEWPLVCHGMFTLTEQKPNANGDSSDGSKLKKPVLHLMTGEDSTMMELVDQFLNDRHYSITVHPSFDSHREAVFKRKGEAPPKRNERKKKTDDEALGKKEQKTNEEAPAKKKQKKNDEAPTKKKQKTSDEAPPTNNKKKKKKAGAKVQRRRLFA